jgi:hypothetical protein
LRLVLTGAVLVLSAIDGLIAMKIGMFNDSFPRAMAPIIRQYTNPGDKLIVYSVTPMWGGEELSRSARKGFYVFSLDNLQGGSASKGLRDLLDSEEDMRRLKSLGYNKLVLLSESPVQFAVQAVNPGSQRRRVHYPEHISQKVDAWPVVYKSEDILIKQIQ